MTLAQLWTERLPRIRARLVERAREEIAAEGARADRLRAAGRRIADVLCDEHGARRVWLFGSLAGGNVHAESDLDLLVDGLLPDRLSAALESAMAIAPEVDLVRWEDAPAGLRELALQYGELLVDRG